MSPDERDEALIEATLTVYRERDADGMPAPPPAWWDLAPEAREQAYRGQLAARAFERALDPLGLNSTVRAVLSRIL
jgi:hypothetical protein